MKKKFGITQAVGECEDCSWKYFGKNALGIAAFTRKASGTKSMQPMKSAGKRV